jgi:hypothetical protein
MLHTTYTSHAVQRCTMQCAAAADGDRPPARALHVAQRGVPAACRTRSATSFSQLAMATPVRWVLASIRSDVPNFHDADFDAEGLAAQRCEIGIVKVLPASATRCSMLHHVATSCNMQHVATRCSIRHHVAARHGAVQRAAIAIGNALPVSESNSQWPAAIDDLVHARECSFSGCSSPGRRSFRRGSALSCVCADSHHKRALCFAPLLRDHRCAAPGPCLLRQEGTDGDFA